LYSFKEKARKKEPQKPYETNQTKQNMFDPSNEKDVLVGESQ
jgi:hypothetical protein